MDIANLLNRQLKAADRLMESDDEHAAIAWWRAQIESLARKAPAIPTAEIEAATPEHSHCGAH